MKPTEDDFIAWREQPMSKWFMQAVANMGKANQVEVQNRAWDAAVNAEHQNADSHALNALAAKALCFHDIYTADFHKINEWQGNDD